MLRKKHLPLRNKINLLDPMQVCAWSRRLDVSVDALKVAVDKVGNSVAAVTKEIELRRASHRASPGEPIRAPAAKDEQSTPI
jgi:hypothetical protein